MTRGQPAALVVVDPHVRELPDAAVAVDKDHGDVGRGAHLLDLVVKHTEEDRPVHIPGAQALGDVLTALHHVHHGIVSTLLYFLDDGPHQRGVVRVLQRVLILGAAQDDGNDIRSVLREAAGGCIGDISTPLNDLTDALSVLL